MTVCQEKQAEVEAGLYSPEELLVLGKIYVLLAGVPEDLHEDAVQEFAISAWLAGKAVENAEAVKSFQLSAGRCGSAGFLHHERRQSGLQKRYLRRKSRMDSFAGATDRPDPCATDPVCKAILDEEQELAECLLQTLEKLERDVVTAILLEGKTRKEVAEEYGMDRHTVGKLFEKILTNLEKRCATGGVKSI